MEPSGEDSDSFELLDILQYGARLKRVVFIVNRYGHMPH